jgi:hypothetical protein
MAKIHPGKSSTEQLRQRDVKNCTSNNRYHKHGGKFNKLYRLFCVKFHNDEWERIVSAPRKIGCILYHPRRKVYGALNYGLMD